MRKFSDSQRIAASQAIKPGRQAVGEETACKRERTKRLIPFQRDISRPPCQGPTSRGVPTNLRPHSNRRPIRWIIVQLRELTNLACCAYRERIGWAGNHNDPLGLMTNLTNNPHCSLRTVPRALSRRRLRYVYLPAV